MRTSRRFAFSGLIIPGLLAGVWLWAGSTGRIAVGLFPSLPQVVRTLAAMVQSGTLWGHITASIARVACGWLAAAAVGIPLGLAIGLSRRAEAFVGPTLHFLRQIPPIAWIPLFLAWMGIGELSKFAVIFYAAVSPIILNTALGVRSIPREFWEVAQVLCLPVSAVFKKLIWPGSRAAVSTGLRVALGLSWRALVAAEMLAGTSGLGYLVMSGRVLVRTDEMLVGVVCIGLVGMWIEWAFGLVENRLTAVHEVVAHDERNAAPARRRFQEVRTGIRAAGYQPESIPR